VKVRGRRRWELTSKTSPLPCFANVINDADAFDHTQRNLSIGPGSYSLRFIVSQAVRSGIDPEAFRRESE
jgi:hypothetical protein